MPKDSFVLVYDGAALEDGSMDIRQLAPALLAVGDLFERANNLLNENRAHISVRVAAVEHGSFVLHLDLWQTVFEQVKTLFSLENISTISDLVDNLFGKAAGVVGVFELIRLLRGKKAKRRRTLQNGNVELELPDGSRAEASPKTLDLYEDQRIRQDAAEAVKPVQSEGIDSFEVRRSGQVIERVEKPDVPNFQQAAEKPDYRDADPAIASSAKRAVEIIKPSFADDLVWTVSGGEGERFTAKMADPNFQERVDRGEVFFKKGDLAIVEVATKSWVVDGKLRSEHEITEVYRFEHRDGQQLGLPEERQPEKSGSESAPKLPDNPQPEGPKDGE